MLYWLNRDKKMIQIQVNNIKLNIILTFLFSLGWIIFPQILVNHEISLECSIVTILVTWRSRELELETHYSVHGGGNGVAMQRTLLKLMRILRDTPPFIPVESFLTALHLAETNYTCIARLYAIPRSLTHIRT